MKRLFDFIVFVFLVAAFFAAVAVWQKDRTLPAWHWTRSQAKQFLK